jgi:hypothetical protein
MNYKFVFAIIFNVLLFGNFAPVMAGESKENQHIIGYDSEPVVDVPASKEGRERLKKFNDGIDYICKKITAKNLAVLASMNICGFASASYCFNNLDCSSETAMIAAWISAIGCVALSQCILPDNNPDYFANMLQQCSSAATTFISYLVAEQCGCSSLSATLPALVTGVGFHYACTPAIRKYCYELHPEAEKRIVEIDEELEKIDVEAKQIAKKITKKSEVKTTAAGKMRMNKNGEMPLTKPQLRIKLEKLKEKTAALAREKSELEKQRISKIDRAIKKYFSGNRIAVETDTNFIEASIPNISTANENSEKKIKKKTHGEPNKNGKEKKPNDYPLNAVEIDENSIEISYLVKRDLMKANIKKLFKHKIKLNDLTKILKLVGYKDLGHTGGHQQFRAEHTKRFPVATHGTKMAEDYQRQEVIDRLLDLSITEDLVRSWYQHW